jgi:hypothetical protein
MQQMDMEWANNNCRGRMQFDGIEEIVTYILELREE